MFLKDIFISNFRNLINVNLNFVKGKNLIFGLNGSGKTSILESIYVLTTGKSFLNVRRKEVVNYNKDNFFIKTNLLKNNELNELKCSYFKDSNKFFVLLNEKKTNPLEVKEIIFPVFFSSSGFLDFVMNKKVKRKTIDRLIFGVNSLYLHYILRYNKALKQKNFILKHGSVINQLYVWNKVLAEMGIKIMKIRKEFIDKINKELFNKFDNFKLDYIPNISLSNSSIDEYYNRLNSDIMNEINYKRTLNGVHLDDYIFYYKTNDLKYHSSGEKKLNVFKFYISYINLYIKVNNELPVFLIDDFDTSMDEFNVRYITDNYPDIQIIATSVNDHSKFNYRIDINKIKES